MICTRNLQISEERTAPRFWKAYMNELEQLLEALRESAIHRARYLSKDKVARLNFKSLNLE